MASSPFPSAGPAGERVHSVSVVIPVYRGEESLRPLLAELAPLAQEVQETPAGAQWRVDQVFPVWDNGPDHSDETIRELAARHDFVRPVWLARNFGQHPATMAGMASTGGDWIVTMDEDGQQDPADIGRMLDVALAEGATVVYGKPLNPPPHGALRNWASRTAKAFLSRVMGHSEAGDFNSFRLVLGETGRALAAYAGPGIYLDVALGWISRRTATCPVTVREEGRPSGYTWTGLVSHFLRMLVTSGTRGLRVVTFTGLLVGSLGVLLALFLGIHSLVSPAPVQGWTSLMCVLLLGIGAILAALGVVAEYIGVTVNTALGKPLYLIGSDPRLGPLGDPRVGRAEAQQELQ